MCAHLLNEVSHMVKAILDNNGFLCLNCLPFIFSLSPLQQLLSSCLQGDTLEAS
jgi:hypothetical protein